MKQPSQPPTNWTYVLSNAQLGKATSLVLVATRKAYEARANGDWSHELEESDGKPLGHGDAALSSFEN